MMPRLRSLLLKFRVDALRIRPHLCPKNYYCRQDDPRDGLGVWNRLGLRLGKCNSLERLRIEISPLSCCDLSPSTRSAFAYMIVGAVLNNGASPVGYGVEVDIRDSSDIPQL
ncbi:hypothetical protein P691DRAFT_808610 [Macrolepiota fuliginosa MF-IS2]|uniref:Uncharacterized protein n=1 Tax=Macrolepiota fuliginosa MF-IS2 TaxID=1400762 RepID=A0A9P5XPQ1_9AGAR|nr:hypothetical protein P691DRAFT_808610 [Macrolepiota fuliginosa MF-IS2]